MPLVLRDGDEAALRRLTEARSVAVGLARRAQICLLAAQGLPHTEVAELTGTSVPTVRHWRSRYEAGGIAALTDAARSGRPRSVDEVQIVIRTLDPPPGPGTTHWSSRLLAAELGVAPSTVAQVWRFYGLQPWRREEFTFSTDPRLTTRIRDVVGLYLNGPDNAIVLSTEAPPLRWAPERTRANAPGRANPPGRTNRPSHSDHPNRPGPPGPNRWAGPSGPPGQPGLLAHSGRAGRPRPQAHGRMQPGTTALLGALQAAAGRTRTEAERAHGGGHGHGRDGDRDRSRDRSRNTEFLRFLKRMSAAYPSGRLHVVCDGDRLHRHAGVRTWLARNARVTVHFPPAQCSWLTMVEIFFRLIEREAEPRGPLVRADTLAAAVKAFGTGSGERYEPFSWTTDLGELLRAKQQETMRAPD